MVPWFDATVYRSLPFTCMGEPVATTLFGAERERMFVPPVPLTVAPVVTYDIVIDDESAPSSQSCSVPLLTVGSVEAKLVGAAKKKEAATIT